MKLKLKESFLLFVFSIFMYSEQGYADQIDNMSIATPIWIDNTPGIINLSTEEMRLIENKDIERYMAVATAHSLYNQTEIIKDSELKDKARSILRATTFGTLKECISPYLTLDEETQERESKKVESSLVVKHSKKLNEWLRGEFNKHPDNYLSIKIVEFDKQENKLTLRLVPHTNGISNPVFSLSGYTEKENVYFGYYKYIGEVPGVLDVVFELSNEKLSMLLSSFIKYTVVSEVDFLNAGSKKVSPANMAGDTSKMYRLSRRAQHTELVFDFDRFDLAYIGYDVSSISKLRYMVEQSDVFSIKGMCDFSKELLQLMEAPRIQGASTFDR